MPELRIEINHAVGALGASVENGKPAAANTETVSTTGTSQDSGVSAPNDDCVAIVTAWGSGAAHVHIAQPGGADAGPTVGKTVAVGQTRIFGGLTVNDVVKYVTA